MPKSKRLKKRAKPPKENLVNTELTPKQHKKKFDQLLDDAIFGVKKKGD